MGTLLNRFPIWSENLSILRSFVKSPFSLVVPKPLYSLICLDLGLIFVIAFAVPRWCITFQLVGIFLVLFHDKVFNP